MEFGQASIVTATVTVRSVPTRLLGFYVNSTTAGTIIFYDATSATNAVTGTITPAIGFHRLPISFGVGIHVAVGGTLNTTLIFQPT
jgi:hypothetical protein